MSMGLILFLNARPFIVFSNALTAHNTNHFTFVSSLSFVHYVSNIFSHISESATSKRWKCDSNNRHVFAVLLFVINNVPKPFSLVHTYVSY